MTVHINGIQTSDKVDEDIVDALGNLLEESVGNLLVGGILREVNGDKQLLCLLIDVADVDTTLVSEKDPIALHKHMNMLVYRGTV